MKYDIAIIGGGPAGLSAAVYAARAGRSVAVLESSACGGQMLYAHKIENYPGMPGVAGMELADAMTAQAKAFDVRFLYKQVSSVVLSPEGFTVRTGAEEMTARAVIAASGTTHRNLNVPGEDEFLGRGVSYCAVCDGRFFRNKDVVVVGGGNTAVGDALYLSDICRSVTLVHRRDDFRADRILVERLNALANVTCILGVQVTSLAGGTRLERVVLQYGDGREQTLSADGIFIAVGSVPNAGYLQGIAGLMLENGYIAADERCRTSIPGLFAAGDVRAKPLRQIVTAVSDGAIAATEAAEFVMKNN